MKKIIDFIVFIIITISFVILFSLITKTVGAENTGRGVPIDISFSGDEGQHPRKDQWLDHFARSDWLCAEYDTPMLWYVQPTVKFTGTVYGSNIPTKYATLNRSTFRNDRTGASQSGTFSSVWTGNKIQAVSYSINMEVTQCSMQYDRNIPTLMTRYQTTTTHSHTSYVYSTGITFYDLRESYSGHFGLGFAGKYAAVAYILAECSYENGLYPSSSYVNHAFWNVAHNYNAYKQLSTTLNDIDYNDGTYNEISFTEHEGPGSSENEDTSAIATRTEHASGLLDEALTFAGMWKIIDMKGGYGKNKTVYDDTDFSQVEVEFDASTNRYRVGPFRLNYLEKYTNSNGAMLCGMSALPKLRVSVDNVERTYVFTDKNSLGNNKRKFTITYNGNRNEAGVPARYRNLLPHTKENFYIEFNYEEGLNAIKGIEFYFRYLDANCSFDIYTAWVQKVRWKSWVTVNSLTCTNQEEHHHSDRFFQENSESHTYHTKADLHWEASVLRLVPCQDPAFINYAQRKYQGSLYGEEIVTHTETEGDDTGGDQSGDDGSGSGGSSGGGSSSSESGSQGASGTGITSHGDVIVPFSWEIDLTTTMAGDVWKEVTPQKDNQSINGYYERNGDHPAEAGMKSVLITVKLYKGTEYIQDAIIHDDNGNRIQWPYVVDASGYYEFKRLAPPATNNDKECFYVVEFQYDGQVYKHTLYLGNPSEIEAGTYNEIEDEEHVWRTVTETGRNEYYQAVEENEPNFKYKDTSMAVENYDERLHFDQTFGEITGDQSINGGRTEGYTVFTDAEGKGGTGSSKTLIYNEDSSAEEGGNLVVSVVDTPFNHKSVDQNRPVSETAYDEQFRMIATTFATNVGDYSKGVENYQIELPVRKDAGLGDRKWILNRYVDTNKVRIGGKHVIGEYMLHINLGLEERPKTDMSLLKDLYGVTFVVNEQKIIQPYSYLKDIEASDYNAVANLLLEKKGDKYTLGLYESDITYQSYQRYHEAVDEVFNIKEGTELRIFATYAIRIYNNSEKNDVELNGLNDYYDGTFTYIDKDLYTPIVDEKLHRNSEKIVDSSYYRIMNTKDGPENNVWKETKEKNMEAAPADLSGLNRPMTGEVAWVKGGDVNGMHTLTTSSFTNIKLQRNEYIEIFTTFEIDKEGYQEMQNHDADGLSARENLLEDKYNIAEIANYSTYYSNYDRAFFYTGYEIPHVSGRVEQDSAPNNIYVGNLKDESLYEDDTFGAIPLEVKIETVKRSISGKVFEDEKNVEKGQYEILTGDGKLGENDKGIPDIEVSLYEVINLGSVGKDENGSNEYNTAYDAFDYYYKVPEEFYEGSLRTGSNGDYYLEGFLAGDYIVRFDYGKYKDDEDVYKYNGQDYENTAFIVDDITYLNKKYLDVTGKELDLSNDYSVARDNESRRMVVDSYSRTIENDRGEILRDKQKDEFKEATVMHAETPIIQVEVLDPKQIEKSENGEPDYFEKFRALEFGFKNYEYSITNINFGLEERAKTNIILEEYINRIMMYKDEQLIFSATMQDDGTIIVNAPDTTNLSKVSYIPHVEATKPNEGLYQQGFYSITVENEFLNGLEIYMRYKIKAFNKSDVDFTGNLSHYYAARDIIKRANQTPTYESAEYLIAWLADDENIALGLSSNSTLAEILAYRDSGLEALITADDASIRDTDTIRPQVIIYGKYTGRYYYQNRIDEEDRVYTISNYTGHGRDTSLEDISVTYSGDKIVKTTVDQLVDYVDVDASFAEDSNSIDGTWSTEIERADDREPIRIDDNGLFKSFVGIISKDDAGGESGVYRLVDGILNIYDDKDRSFITKDKSNIAISYNERLDKLEHYRTNYEGPITYLDKDYSDTGRREYAAKKGGSGSLDEIVKNVISLYNPSLTRELVPEKYKDNGGMQEGEKEAEMYITVTKQTSSDADANQLNFDNLVEVLVYSNTVGRRDTTSVPGNAMKIATRDGMWLAGYNSYDENKTYDPEWKEPEDDAYAPELISSIPPNGLPMRQYLRTYVLPIVILIIAMMGLLSLFGIKQIKLRKNDNIL